MSLRPLSRSFVTGLCLLALVLPTRAADKTVPLPEAFEKRVPEGVKDLREIQGHVNKVVDRCTPYTVGLRIGAAQGSGVIIDKEGHILTAGHVSGEVGRKVEVILHDGRKLKGVTLGSNVGIDSGLVKITDPGEYPFAEMAHSAELKRGQWCLAIGHPGGYQTGRLPVVRLGRILDVSSKLLRTDCTLVGGDSGGPLFDMHGKVIGIHSRIGGSISYNIHVPVDTYRETWDRLAASEVWGKDFGLFNFARPNAGYLGIQADPDAKPMRITGVTPDSPAAKAGLLADDIILKLDKSAVESFADLTRFLGEKSPGNEIAVHIRRGTDTRTLTVVLGKRPE